MPLSSRLLSLLACRVLQVMGAFASLYGEVTARVASTSKVEYGLGVFSALLSVIVGIGWITLLCTGKLQAFFG